MLRVVSALRLPNRNCSIGGEAWSNTLSPIRMTSIFIFNERSCESRIEGSTVSLTPVSRNSTEVTVEVVGTAPVVAWPGSTFVVDNRIGCLSPMLTSPLRLLTTRSLGDARVFASVTDLKKSSTILVGSLNRKLSWPRLVSCR